MSKEFCRNGHPMSGANLRVREQRKGDRVYEVRECRRCAADRANTGPGADLLRHVRRSIKANMPSLAMSQADAHFWSRKGCHPNSALGRAIRDGDTATRMRAVANMSRDAAERGALERWARRECA